MRIPLVLILIGCISACFTERAWCQSAESQSILNFSFDQTGVSKKSGPAAVGNQGDYWNPVHPVEGLNYKTDAEKINDMTRQGFQYADREPANATIRMINLGGGWTGPWAIHDPMFNNINYQYDIVHANNGGPAYIYLSNLRAGTYDLYLYGPIGRYQVSVDGNSYGRKDSTQNEYYVNTATQWVEGVHFQRFQGLSINSSSQIKIDLIQSDNPTHDAPISGLQLVPSGMPIVQGVLYGTEAESYIQRHAAEASKPHTVPDYPVELDGGPRPLPHPRPHPHVESESLALNLAE